MVGKRHHDDVGEHSNFDDAALDEPAEVQNERLALLECCHAGERLPRLPRDDAVGGQGRLVDVNGVVIEVVGDENAAACLA